MKIEIAESLARSWLRHCEKCQIAELNWKPSPSWSLSISPELETIFDDIRLNFPNALKKTSTLNQFLKQAEIDVLGLRIASTGQVEKIYAIDSAFHSKGLSYGNNEETQGRIQKKLLRTGLLLKALFPATEAHVMFISPVINPGRSEVANKAFEEVKSFFYERSSLAFELCGSEIFRDRILHPVLSLSATVADTSEIFLRAWQLVAPFIKDKSRFNERLAEEELSHSSGNDRDYSDKRAALIAAYYMSKYEHNNLEFGNQCSTLKEIAKVLGVKQSTLQNMRDSFDPYTGSHRKGWHQAPLSPQYKSIHNEFMLYEEFELRKVVLQLLKRTTASEIN